MKSAEIWQSCICRCRKKNGFVPRHTSSPFETHDRYKFLASFIWNFNQHAVFKLGYREKQNAVGSSRSVTLEFRHEFRTNTAERLTGGTTFFFRPIYEREKTRPDLKPAYEGP